MKAWRKVTPVPIEFNGHGYLWTCTNCGYCLTWLVRGNPNKTEYQCPKCRKEGEDE